MSLFNELCNSYASARDRYINCRNDAYRFVKDLTDGFVKHIDIPPELIIYYPAKEEYDPQKTYAPSIYLDNDTYWHFTFQMTIYESRNTFPHQPILMFWRFRKVDNEYIIIATSDNKEWTINPTTELDKLDFYNFLFTLIKSHYDNGLNEFLEKGNAKIVRVMGFTANKSE